MHTRRAVKKLHSFRFCNNLVECRPISIILGTCLTTDTGFILTTFFVLKPNFDIFAEIHQKKMLQIHVAVWTHTYF